MPYEAYCQSHLSLTMTLFKLLSYVRDDVSLKNYLTIVQNPSKRLCQVNESVLFQNLMSGFC